MKDFFKTKRFKVLLFILLLIVGYIVGAARAGVLNDLPSTVIGYITAPFRQFSASLSGSASDLIKKYTRADAIYEENQALKEENRIFREQLRELEAYRIQNEQLKEYLGIREENDDYEYVAGMVIARDPSDKYHSFNIDSGSLDGVSVGNPVFTAHGLVGIVTEVNLTDSKVMTILNPSINVGAYSTQTVDVGIVRGELSLAMDGYTRMNYIPNDSTMVVGNTIVTSGVGGTFPKGLPIGDVIEVGRESTGNSKYAIIDPAVDVTTIKEVMVITYFRGQGTGEENPDLNTGTADGVSGSVPVGAVADGISLPEEDFGELDGESGAEE